MMTAQQVVDTFAPFVGAEGLRGISRVWSYLSKPGLVHFNETIGSSLHTVSIPPRYAHGFLLSRLAEGLAFEDWAFGCDKDRDGGIGWWSAKRRSGKRIEADDYADAVLSAARAEWPSKKSSSPAPAVPDELTIDGAKYRRVTD